jgi:hypothetical protein
MSLDHARALELRTIVTQMKATSRRFYAQATHIGNHPFIEFTGLLNEYIQCCESALAKGIDFTECNAHTGAQLPMQSHEVLYVNEKLECIFAGRSVLAERRRTPHQKGA